MVIIKNRVILLRIADLDGHEATFSMDDKQGELIDVMEYDAPSISYGDELDVVRVDMHPHLVSSDAFDFRPGGIVAVRCDIHYREIDGKNTVMLANAELTCDPVSEDFNLLVDSEESGPIQPLNETLLQEWIDLLRTSSNTISFISGYEAVLSYSHNQLGNAEVHHNHQEIMYATAVERNACKDGLKAVSTEDTLAILSPKETVDLYAAKSNISAKTPTIR